MLGECPTLVVITRGREHPWAPSHRLAKCQQVNIPRRRRTAKIFGYVADKVRTSRIPVFESVQASFDGPSSVCMSSKHVGGHVRKLCSDEFVEFRPRIELPYLNALFYARRFH
jgi:hypothetical protein